jgi:hypothetical protein
MKQVQVPILLLFIVLLSIRCSSVNNIAGQYKSNFHYWRYTISLYKDSTFEYKLNAHMASDSATGRYSVVGDSIRFYYNYTSADSIIGKENAIILKISLDDALFMDRSNFRAMYGYLHTKTIVFNGEILKKQR